MDRVIVDSRGVAHAYSGKLLKLDRALWGDNEHIQLTLCAAPRRRRVQLHVLVLETFVGPRPDGYDGCHNNGDPTDNRLDNLRWDTKSANVLDQVRHGVHYEAARTHCDRGHGLHGANLYMAEGKRRCRVCRRACSKVYRARKAGRVVDWQAIADADYAQLMERAA